MNSIMEQVYPLFELYQNLRSQMMDLLMDEDLEFTPGGGNARLGVLCREIGEVEHSYIQSFKTFEQNFDYRNTDPGIETSVQALKEWYKEIDTDLKQTIEALSQEDIDGKLINRGPEFMVPPRIQLEIYKEALLIFYGKSSVYLKTMGKDLPDQWLEWIA